MLGPAIPQCLEICTSYGARIYDDNKNTNVPLRHGSSVVDGRNPDKFYQSKTIDVHSTLSPSYRSDSVYFFAD